MRLLGGWGRGMSMSMCRILLRPLCECVYNRRHHPPPPVSTTSPPGYDHGHRDLRHHKPHAVVSMKFREITN